MPLRSDHTVAFFGLLGGVDKFVNILNRRRHELRTLDACDIGNVKGYCKKGKVDLLYVCRTLSLFSFRLYSTYILFVFLFDP